jgi:mono/diheme cytochrome c family protein
LFSGACSGCHNLEGGGRQSSFADLTGSRTVADPAAHNILRVLLDGADQRSLHPALYMPSFASAYSDEELAALTNFVVKQFSGRDARVRSGDVHSSRAETAP